MPQTDFILTAADVVTNVDLGGALVEHKERRKKDKECLMTMLCRGNVSETQRMRMGIEPQSVLLEEATGKVLQNDIGNSAALRPMTLSASTKGVVARTDLVDTNVYLCAPEFLVQFSDNWDFQNVCQDFIAGVLAQEELGHKVHVKEISSAAYMATVANWRAYDAVSRDVLQRWAHPFSPDTNCLAVSGAFGPPVTDFRQRRRNLYLETNTRVGLATRCTRDSCIGAGTHIGDGTTVHCSVVGRGCRIGEGAVLSGCYVMDGAVVGDGVYLDGVIVCSGGQVRSGSTVGRGCIVGFLSIVGENHTLPAGTVVSLCRLREEEGARGGRGSDDGWSDDGDVDWQQLAPTDKVREAARGAARGAMVSDVIWDHGTVGADGVGFLWEGHGRFCAPRYSHAHPEPDDVRAWLAGLQEELAGLESKAGGGEDDDAAAGGGEGEDDDPEAHFKQEVVETFLRCVKEKFDLSNVVVELNGLRLAENRTFVDCANYIFTTILGLACPPPGCARAVYHGLFPTEMPETETKQGRMKLLAKAMSLMKEWGSLLKKFVTSEDDEVDILLTLEEFCRGEGSFQGTGEHGEVFSGAFEGLLQVLYHDTVDILTEEGILKWASEKQHADASERHFLDQARDFLAFLQDESGSGSGSGSEEESETEGGDSSEEE